MPETLLSMNFSEDGGIIIDFIDSRLHSQVNGGFLSQLASGPWQLPYWKAWLMTLRSPEKTLNLKIVTPEEDGHAPITHAALTSLKTYLGLSEEDASVLPREVSFRDIPPLVHGNYVSLLAGYFRMTENTSRHALRTVEFDPETGRVTLQSQEETQAGIRESLDIHLSEINRINRALGESPPIFIPGPEMEFLRRELSDMFGGFDGQDSGRLKDTYGDTGFQDTGDTDTGDTGNKNRQEALVEGIKRLRSRFFYAQMRDIRFPHNDSSSYDRAEYLDVVAEPYRDALALMDEASAAFREAEEGNPEAFYGGVEHFRNLLRYIPEENWEQFASGEGPLVAMRQLRLAASLHLAQDYPSHCIEWNPANPNVCDNSVSVNLFGLGTLHTAETDLLTGPDGAAKKEMAQTLSVQILELAQITDKHAFERKKEGFLDQYWPLECFTDDRDLLLD
ncbi:MAG: hypothetical protein HY541_05620 [Deltaproteobacteria bacterium]|nr:hypothetical protein [Deltaproteobacteria bacterium]